MSFKLHKSIMTSRQKGHVTVWTPSPQQHPTAVSEAGAATDGVLLRLGGYPLAGAGANFDNLLYENYRLRQRMRRRRSTGSHLVRGIETRLKIKRFR